MSDDDRLALWRLMGDARRVGLHLSSQCSAPSEPLRFVLRRNHGPDGPAGDIIATVDTRAGIREVLDRRLDDNAPTKTTE